MVLPRLMIHSAIAYMASYSKWQGINTSMFIWVTCYCGDAHCKKSMVNLTHKCGYLSCMFDLTAAGSKECV